MSLAELKAELLRSEFPSLRPDHDPDIERYYDLRALGRSADALSLYESRIKPRYPDDSFRAAALRAFRLKEPAYPAYISKAYGALGDILLERTKRLIKYVGMYAASYDRTDAYATIKAAEAILGLLPRDRFEAIASLERLRRHAELLDYQGRSVAAAEDLVRAYLNEQLDVVQAERERRRLDREREEAERRSFLVEQDRAETRKAIETARQRAAARQEPVRSARQRTRTAPALDLSVIRFSAADLARMQIPPTIVKVEDKTLAFCFKYWNLVEDRAFERVLFLFARKYGVRHYDVYAAIRDGRRRGRRDEEILSAVSGLLTTGYYYSIRGDVYLQRSWARLKAKLEQPDPAASGPARPPRRERRISAPRRTKAALPQEAVPAPQPKPVPAPPPVPSAERKPLRKKEEPPSENRAAPAPRRPRSAKRASGREAAAIVSAPSPAEYKRIAKGSVSDRLRKLSGKSYDVFRDRFLSKARTAIRNVLAETKGGKKTLFPSIPQEAENLVFSFLRDHYADPYMDWETSEERRELEKSGYELPSLDPVIEDCYRRL